MIQKFVDRFMANRDALRASFATKHPESYSEIVAGVVRVLSDDNNNATIDPKRIHEINDGGCQGTLVFVVGATGYQPRTYWYVRIDYGSCSGCDTLQSIHGYRNESPTTEQIDQYMTLALHVVQRMKLMDDTEQAEWG